ncbi:MAG: nicotinate-nucleotide adenylyltransferase [Acidobacteriota bacterium]
MAKKRIGLLGGTFNPVHSGHLRAAAEVVRIFSLSKVLFIPSMIPPHKQSAAVGSAADRFAMVKLAVRGEPRFVASALEIESPKTSYSILTLGRVKSLYPGAWVFFIVGVDAFLEIETWRSYREVLEQCHFVVTSRPGYRLSEARNAVPSSYSDRIMECRKAESVGVEALRCFRIFLVPIKALDVSSTEIRRRVRQGISISGLVPEAVEAYILRKKLYQG